MYVDVLIELNSKKLDKTFTYSVPSFLIPKVKIGKRVLVSFGKQKLEGFIISFNNDFEYEYEVKDIIDIIDEEVILNEEMLSLGRFIQKKTLCSLISAYQTMLPSALKASYNNKFKKKYEIYLTLCNDSSIVIKTEKQRIIYEMLLKNEFVLKKDCIKISSYVVNTFLNKNYIKEIKKEISYFNSFNFIEENNIILNNEQKKCVDSVVNSDGFNSFLLHGVTGSGKTEVYMNIISHYLKVGKEAIVLVPEISLTAQIVSNFKKRFGENIAILHSRLNERERYEEYLKIVNKKVSIVIGARSAIFAPFTNIGVIIIDEEHSNTYKQDNNPRYNAIDIAICRCKYHKCNLVLGSATPSIESYTRALNGVYKLIELKNRVNNNFPLIKLVDMKLEIKKGNNVFSSSLIENINQTIKNGEQVILFLNRRGFSTISSCSNCGFIHKCCNCDLPLIYHKTTNTMKCHYCGFSTYKLKKCIKCNCDSLRDYGMGTEKLEELVKLNLKDARIVRMDLDSTSKKGSHEKIIEEFKNQKYNILIGTQMISKGLDFPLVTLVGIINGDYGLSLPDFRSGERTFQLLNQVSGRAGRKEKTGRVIIQGFNIDHYSVVCAKNNDYINFYKEEMKLRKKLKYPPYYNLCLIKIKSKDNNKIKNEGDKIIKYLKLNLDNTNIILGPSNNNLRINNMYSCQIIIKYKNSNNLIEKIKFINSKYVNNYNINIDIDFNPYTI